MSLFSEMLKQLVDANGSNVYRIAKNAQVDRTTIHKAMSGDRVPGAAFMEKLFCALQLTPSEKNRLLEYYNIAKLGESKYRLRNQVKSIVELIGAIGFPDDSAASPSRRELEFPKRSDVQPFSGVYSVSNMVREVIEEEIYNAKEPKICLCVPVNGTFIFNLLYSLYIQFGGTIQIRHIMRMRKLTGDMSGCLHNLDFLSVAAPFALAKGEGYKPFYYYGDDGVDQDLIADASYRIITSKHVVSLSADLKSAILYSTEEMVGHYRMGFEGAESASFPFILPYGDPEVRRNTEKTWYGGACYMIKPQPCFFLTPDQLKSKLIFDRPGVYEFAKPWLAKAEMHGTFNKESICVFSMEGLERFVDGGFVDDSPKYLMNPFTIKERIEMLSTFKNALVCGLITAAAADCGEFKITGTLTVLLNDEGLNFSVIDGEGRSFRTALVCEEGIKAAFRDFFESLPVSGLVYQKSDMLRAVDGFIEKLKGMAGW